MMKEEIMELAWNHFKRSISIFVDHFQIHKENIYIYIYIYIYIFAMINRFSRYISLTPITKQDEETVTKTIKEKWILKFFVSRGMQKLAMESGMKMQFSSPYHQNTNGLV